MVGKTANPFQSDWLSLNPEADCFLIRSSLGLRINPLHCSFYTIVLLMRAFKPGFLITSLLHYKDKTPLRTKHIGLLLILFNPQIHYFYIQRDPTVHRISPVTKISSLGKWSIISAPSLVTTTVFSRRAPPTRCSPSRLS